LDSQVREPSGVPILAARTFRLEGDVYKLVTFLNQALKGRGLAFGMSKHPEGVQLTIYSTQADSNRERR